MNFFCSLAVIIAMLLFSIIYQTILVDSQNVPSLGVLHYMYKKYPNMKLQQCIEAVNQCQMFSSCKGIYLHLPTGECLFDNSKIKSDEFTSTTTEATKELVSMATDLTTEQVAVSTEPITDSLSTTTEAATALVAMTTKSKTTQVSTTTISTTKQVAMTTEPMTEQVSMTTESSTELLPTLQPITNTSIYFQEESTDHKIYAKTFDTAELSVCFWMKPESTIRSVILSIFKIPVSKYSCNDLQIRYQEQKLRFWRQGPIQKTSAKNFHAGESSYVCLTWNLTQVFFYANGVFDKKYDVDHEKLVASHFAVGNDVDPAGGDCVVNDASASFRGEIAGLNIWNRILNESEIEKIYINGIIPANNLAVAWEDILKFDTTNKITKKNFTV